MVHRSDDRRAADADAKEQDAKLSTCEKWKAHDRFAKIFFMIIYLIINIALWIHWAYNAYNQVTQGTPQIGDDPDTAIPPTKLSSIWIPIAKGCGQVLNFNCALIVVPVITELLHWLHDVKVQQGREEEGTAHKGSETTLSKCVPLGKKHHLPPLLCPFLCSHFLGRISPIFPRFSPVFCAFSPSRRGGSNEPQAGTQGQETAGTPETAAL